MTRADLVEAIVFRCRLTQARAELLVETVFDCLQSSLLRGEPVEIPGFGAFDVRHGGPRRGGKPRTGQAVPAKVRQVPFFTASPALLDRMNTVQDPPVKLVHRGTGVLRKATGITGVWMAIEEDEAPRADEITRRMC